MVFAWRVARELSRASVASARTSAIALDLTLLFAAAMLVGAQLSYAALHPDRPGGLRAGALVFLVLLVPYLVWAKGARRAISDACAVALPFGLAAAKVGCFVGGCCYGAETDLPWGVPLGPLGTNHGDLRVHPTQLYDLLSLFGAAALAWGVARRQAGTGKALAASVLVMALGRFASDFTRGELEGPVATLVTRAVVLAGASIALVALAVPAVSRVLRRFIEAPGPPRENHGPPAPLALQHWSVALVLLMSGFAVLGLSFVMFLRRLRPGRLEPTWAPPSMLFRWLGLGALVLVFGALRHQFDAMPLAYATRWTWLPWTLALTSVGLFGIAWVLRGDPPPAPSALTVGSAALEDDGEDDDEEDVVPRGRRIPRRRR